jgi:hypothetical protein
MERYWKDRPRAPPPAKNSTQATKSASASVLSDYDRYRQTLVADADLGWEPELRRYLKDMPANVTPETDIIEWWQVCCLILRL